MIDITLYTKSDCSLCDTLKADLLAIQPKIGFVLLEKDVEDMLESEGALLKDDKAKIDKYRNLLPVLDIEYGEVLYSPFSYDELFDAIDRAVEKYKRSEG